MSTPTITDPAQLDAADQRTEPLLQEAAEAKYAAFVRWRQAYGMYDIACYDAIDAPDHSGSVYLGRCHYFGGSLLALVPLSEDSRGGGPFLEVPRAQL